MGKGAGAMMFDSLSAFLDMGGHGPFVWSAYGITLIVFAYNIFAPIRHRKKMLREIHQRMERDAA